jgi:Uma2 family endonuclease
MAISEQQSASPYVGRRMTLDEFLKLPEQDGSLEYDDGTVTQKVAPQADHGRAQFKLAGVFERSGEDTGLGLVFTETRFVTPTWAPTPDISFYLHERIHPRSEEQIGDFHEPPDIAVEVSSPDQSLGELFQKCIRYADLGVRISLLVAVNDRSVFVFRPGEQTVALRGSERIDLHDVLPAFDLTVDGLFGLILPRRPQSGSPPA